MRNLNPIDRFIYAVVIQFTINDYLKKEAIEKLREAVDELNKNKFKNN